MEWNDETIGRLRMLWSDGHSTAEIGRRLGVSKNAIVGKAHRLELPARPSPIRRDGSLGLPSRPAIRRVAGPTLPPLPSAERPAAAAHRRSDAVRAEPSRPEPARTELAQSELAQSELAQSELSRSDLAQAELARSEPALLRPIAAVPVPGQGRAAPPVLLAARLLVAGRSASQARTDFTSATPTRYRESLTARPMRNSRM